MSIRVCSALDHPEQYYGANSHPLGLLTRVLNSLFHVLFISIHYLKKTIILRPKKGLWFLVSAHVISDLHVGIYSFLFAAKIAGSIGIPPCCVLNDFFHIWVWTFARFVRPLLATILCILEIWSGSNNRVYMNRVFHWLRLPTILKLTYDQKSETFLGA